MLLAGWLPRGPVIPVYHRSSRGKSSAMPDAGEEVLAFPDTQARRLAGVSMRRMRYWEEVGLVVPSIKRRLSEHNTVRLYSYQDLLALLVVSALRTERDMSLQSIRRVVTHLRSRGYQAPLRELKFATVGREIYFQHPDGRWEGDLQPDQIVIVEVIFLDRSGCVSKRRPRVRPRMRAMWRSAAACMPARRCLLAPGSGSRYGAAVFGAGLPDRRDPGGISRPQCGRCRRSSAATGRSELVRFLLDHDVDAAVGKVSTALIQMDLSRRIAVGVPVPVFSGAGYLLQAPAELDQIRNGPAIHQTAEDGRRIVCRSFQRCSGQATREEAHGTTTALPTRMRPWGAVRGRNDHTTGRIAQMTAADPGARPGTGDEDLRWQRPSPRLLRARRIEVALVTVPLALIGGFAGGAGLAPRSASWSGSGWRCWAAGRAVPGPPGRRLGLRRAARRPDGPARGADPPPVGHPVRADAVHRRHRGPGGAQPGARDGAYAHRRRGQRRAYPWPGTAPRPAVCATSSPRSAKRRRPVCDQPASWPLPPYPPSGLPARAPENMAGWHRLHPLSPLVRTGRHLVSFLVLFLVLIFANASARPATTSSPTWSSSRWCWSPA